MPIKLLEQGSPIGYCLSPTNPSNNGGIRAATTLVSLNLYFLLQIIQGRRTKVVKTADLQAHNASHREALCACRSAVFTSLNHFLNDKYKTNGFGHTRFPPNNNEI